MGNIWELDPVSGADDAFDEELRRHLDAIASRDIGAFDATLDDDVALVTSGGEVVTDRGEIVARHRDWFASSGWRLDVTELRRYVGTDVATALLRLDLRDGDVHEESILHLTFVRRGDRWLMAEDQNTPIRAR